MPRKLPRTVQDHLAKCRSAATAAVDGYNRSGARFRTPQYVVLMTIAWTAYFHALFHSKGLKPWYQTKGSGSGRGVRYQRVDGEPRHWELSECLRRHFGSNHPPERENLEFVIGLRNKIEHRHIPELDPQLYGECQAALLNLEAALTDEFGASYALADQLAVSLQFSRVIPEEKRRAAKALASSEAKGVTDYVERFRGRLPSTTLNSMNYSFSVFLVPKVANRESAADAAVEFVRADEASPEELERLEKLNVLIREKQVPISNLGLYKPGEVVRKVQEEAVRRFNMANHVQAWRFFGVRPAGGDGHPDRTRSEYCVFDAAHEDYLYTEAWVRKLIRTCRDAAACEAAFGWAPGTASVQSD